MKDGKLHCSSICVISDDLEHDTPFVYQVQSEVVQYLKKSSPMLLTLNIFQMVVQDCIKTLRTS